MPPDRPYLSPKRTTGLRASWLARVGTRFNGTIGFTAAHLYSTASYKAHNLSGVGLGGLKLTGVNLAGQHLANASFGGTTLTNANFFAADTRGADGLPDQVLRFYQNAILPDGQAAVPGPTTIMLAALGGVLLLVAGCRRRPTS